jgi:cobaltochelatase CobS
MEEHDTIRCELCGREEAASLFRHLREAHGLAPEAYQARCPGSLLFTPVFGQYLRENGIAIDKGKLVRHVNLFGVAVTVDALPGRHVPEVDGKYTFDPVLAKAALLSLLANDRMLLVGPTGSGKSSLVVQLAARLHWPLRRVNLHGETGVSDFLGTFKARNGEVYFQYGLLPTAMREGQILVLEELDAATPEILFALQGVLEEEGTLTLAENGGEIVPPHPNFRLVATANTLGRGDESGLYTGTNVLNASHLDRWNVVYSVGYPPPEQETAIIREKAPDLPPALVEGMIKLAREVRKAVAEEQLYTTFSTRRLLAFARKIASLGLEQALAATVLNKLTAEERRVVAELAQRHLPGLEDAA